MFYGTLSQASIEIVIASQREAIQNSARNPDWIASSRALLAMTRLSIPATHIASGSCYLPPTKGRGECRAHDAPAASCVKNKTHELVTTGPPNFARHSRTRMVLTVSSVLSPVNGLCCHRHPQARACALDASVAASGPHDFAVRSSRHSSRAQQASIASRTQRS